MRRSTFLSLLCLLLVTTASAFAQGPTFHDPGFSRELVADLPAFTPIGFAFGPAGRIYVWQKDGFLKVVKNGAVSTVLNINCRVNRAVDRGLIGFALDPNFSSNGYFYLAYVYEPNGCGSATGDTPRTQRVSRFQMTDPANPDTASAATETVLIGSVTDPNCNLSSDCMPNDIGTHTIDHLAFGPDGKLYVSVGDGSSYKKVDQHAFDRAQNLDALNGKILRINTDGTGPADNPFYNGNPSANRSKVYNYGLRNPFRFWIREDGTVLIGDVGWLSFEEINTGRGKNFGWPCFEGEGPEARYSAQLPSCAGLPAAQVTPPLYSYPNILPPEGEGASITLGPVYTGTAYPAQYQGNIFYSDYPQRFIRRVILNGNGGFQSSEDFATDVNSPVFLTEGPEGDIYYSDFENGNIYRIKFTSGNTPPAAVIEANPTSGVSPLNVTFSAAGSTDREGDALTYSWDFGDGGTATGVQATHLYTSATPQTFTATLSAQDSAGGTGTASVAITIGSTAPTVSLTTTPAPGTVRPGDVVTYSATASDVEDGALQPAALHWNVLLKHNDHIHTVSDLNGAGGEFTVEDHDAFGTFSYLIKLVATDSSGLQTAREVEFPVDDPPFTVTPASGTATVSPGESAAYVLHFVPKTGFQGQVALSCDAPPATIGCTFTPATLELTSGTPQDVQVSVRTSAPAMAMGIAPVRQWPGTPVAALLASMLVTGMVMRKRRWPLAAFMALMVGLVFVACGGGNGTPTPVGGTQPGNYTIRVMATSGSKSVPTDLTLTVR